MVKDKDKLGAVKGVFALMHDDSTTEEPKEVIPAQQQTIVTEEPKDVKPVKAKSENEKVTYYLHPTIIEKLNDLQGKIRKESKEKKPLSTLVTEALQAMFEKHGIE